MLNRREQAPEQGLVGGHNETVQITSSASIVPTARNPLPPMKIARRRHQEPVA
jgi:hypothetical protein